MDFGTLIHKAQKNDSGGKKEGVRYYSTKFEPPKKEQRNKQQLSNNIKKFLAKKEAEENKKKLEALRKKEELLALRAKDKKATRRVNVMLKRTKSANQSVLQDAVDTNNTSVTLAGPIQPDEDDYGYVSQEAAAFYNKMMEKYSKMPDEPKFSLDKKKKVSMDLNGTKERVKAALEREREEANMPHRRKRSHKEESVAEAGIETVPPPEPPKQKPRATAPPPLNFQELLKLAEKKQFEPIVIEQKPKEEERLYTKKQKKELEREKEWKDRKEGKIPPLEKSAPPNKIPKLNSEKNKFSSDPTKIPKHNSSLGELSSKKINSDKIVGIRKDILKKTVDLNKRIAGISSKVDNKKTGSNSFKVPLQNNKSQADTSRVANSKITQPIKSTLYNALTSKQLPPKDLKPRQFSPSDVHQNSSSLTNTKRKPVLSKRRILDDDEEYDSELDDFIDDGPEEEEDYSKYISEIFGYDKSKYRNIDDDIDNMESSFAQQMKEEVISTKIGIMEDLEDMKKEEEEKKRKALMKKKLR